MARRYALDGRIGALRARGASLAGDVAEAVLDGDLDLSTGEVSQLNLTVHDPDLKLLGSRLFDPPRTASSPGSALDYAGLKFAVSAVALSGGSAYSLGVTARALGAQKLRAKRGAMVRRSMSPTEFVSMEAKAAGLVFVGEASSQRRTIARAKDESSWDACQRLAKEVGFFCFEAAGTLYFGRPTWLVARNPRVAIAWRGASSAEELITPPSCRRTGDDPESRLAATVDLEVAAQLGDKLRPGMALDLSGIPTFNGRYLITGVKIPLAGAAAVSVSAVTPDNPEPEPPSAPGGSSASPGAGGGSGTGTVQVPKAGVYGGTRFSTAQLQLAAVIDRTGRKLGATDRDVICALMCAMQESTLRTGAAVRGKDHDSVGPFQQRPSMDWGTVKQCEDTTYASTQFYKRLFKVPGRASKNKSLAIQAVQRSAHPMAYAKWEDAATAIWRAIDDAYAAAKKAPATSRPAAKTAALFVQICLSQAGDPYVFGAEARLGDTDPDRFDCSELVEWASYRAGVRIADGTYGQLGACQKAGTTVSVERAYRIRGALLFKMNTDIRHVAVSLGDGKRTIEAAGRSYGNKVRVGSVDRTFHWTHAGLIPGMMYVR